MANVIPGTSLPDHLIGTDDDDVILGYDGDDRLYGLGGDDVLQGGGNAGVFGDVLFGGPGNDTYLIPSTGLTSVVELAGQGIDTVYTVIDFVLPANVENLVCLEPGLVPNATGNALNNVISGNFGHNTLRGLGGNDTLNDDQNSEFPSSDTMIGGAGNDSYFVDTANDVINEQADGGSGIDTVRSTISFSLNNSSNVLGTFENLTLLGSAANGLGNALSNVIIGNAGNNLINGGGGADTLQGLGGHDAYVVDSALDKVIEAAGQGTDTVNASVSYTLAAGVAVETLKTLNAAATTAINLTGNNLANVVTGNAGNNILNAGAGNDTLNGFLGSDTLIGNLGKDTSTGGGGNDIFRHLATIHSPVGAGADVILDFDDSNDDRIDVSALFGPAMIYRHNLAFTAAGQVRINDVAGADVIVEVNTGGTLAADMQIRLTNTTLASMTGSDFLL